MLHIESGGVDQLVSFAGSDGKTRLISARDTAICLWDAATGARLGEYTGQNCVNGVAVSAAVPGGTSAAAASCVRGGRIVAVAMDYDVMCWDADTCQPRFAQLDSVGDTIWAVTFATMADGSTTLFGAGHCGPFGVYRWDMASGRALPPFVGHDDSVKSLATVPWLDGSTVIAAGDNAETIRLWDPVTGRQVGSPMTGHTWLAYPLATTVLADSRVILASGDGRGVLRRWDPWTGELLGQSTAHEGGIITITPARTSDRQELITSGADCVVRRWDAITGTFLGELGHGYTATIIPSSPADRVATSNETGITIMELPSRGA